MRSSLSVWITTLHQHCVFFAQSVFHMHPQEFSNNMDEHQSHAVIFPKSCLNEYGWFTRHLILPRVVHRASYISLCTRHMNMALSHLIHTTRIRRNDRYTYNVYLSFRRTVKIQKLNEKVKATRSYGITIFKTYRLRLKRRRPLFVRVIRLLNM